MFEKCCNANTCILVEDKELREFGKFKPYRSVRSYKNQVPEYAVDGSIGENLLKKHFLKQNKQANTNTDECGSSVRVLTCGNVFITALTADFNRVHKY